MRRVFAVDVLACPAFGGRLRLVATMGTSRSFVTGAPRLEQSRHVSNVW
jgi:hypothetical protein